MSSQLKVARICAEFSARELGIEVQAHTLLPLVEKVLFGERKLIACHDAGIVTSAEVAQAMGEHFITSLNEISSEISERVWDNFVKDIEAVLF